MSGITGPGFYRQRNGGKAEVFAERDGWWYGMFVDANGARVPEAWSSDGKSTLDILPNDITGPWIEPPDPGEGWRLLEDDEVIAFEDQVFVPCDNVWSRLADCAPVGDTAIKARDFFSFSPSFYRRRIEPPFRISDHGPGVYETRDGRKATVLKQFGRGWSSRQDDAGFEWYDNGRRSESCESPGDLVRYLRPLDTQAPPAELKPTGRLRWLTPSAGCWHGATLVSAAFGNTLEQEFTDGTNTEWRPVPIMDGR